MATRRQRVAARRNLRMGTASGVGPRDNLDNEFLRTDLGMDRVSPRGADPLGWPIKGTQEPSRRIDGRRRGRS